MKPREPSRIGREKATVSAMIRLYCRAHHATDGRLCSECRVLADYALTRLDRCPFGGDKSTCAKCRVHCYNASMREQVRVVMRYAGPRMLLRHPLLALRHQLDGLKPAEDLRKT